MFGSCIFLDQVITRLLDRNVMHLYNLILGEKTLVFIDEVQY